MKDRIENKMGTIRRVRDLLSSNMPILGAYSGLVGVINTFHTKAGELSSLIEEQDLRLKGITEEKAQIREKAVSEAFRISGLLRSYADSIENLELFEEAYFPEARMMILRDDHLVAKLNNIYTLANTHQGALAPFGLTPAELANYMALVNEYTAWVQRPIEARTHRHNVTLRIDELMREIDHLMKRRLDTAMVVIRNSHPMLYHDYLGSRRVMDTGHRRKKTAEADPSVGYLFVTVRGVSDNVVIEGARLLVDETLIDETDEDGETYAEKLSPGTHRVRVECEGYTAYETNVSIESGDEMTLEVMLEEKVVDPGMETDAEEGNE